MERIDQKAIGSGIDFGLKRSEESLRGFRRPEPLFAEVEKLVLTALKRVQLPPPAWGSRGQATCAELAAMAAAARMQNGEPSLSLEDVLEFIRPLGRFLNSWVHE